MSRAPSSLILLTLRKVSSGYKVVSFQGEDQNHLYSIAKVLVRSPEYCRCYACATSWDGSQLFTVYPEAPQVPAPYSLPQVSQVAAPMPHYPPPLPFQPRFDAYQAEPAPSQSARYHAVPQPSPYIEAEILPALPAYKGNR